MVIISFLKINILKHKILKLEACVAQNYSNTSHVVVDLQDKLIDIENILAFNTGVLNTAGVTCIEDLTSHMAAVGRGNSRYLFIVRQTRAGSVEEEFDIDPDGGVI
ncbi:MAG: hypothetical protein HOK80_09110 [Candidatus Cloacimonetes bacterium]|nr:hypothetical protein [Candidatus Cloacimonadota bacterium]